MKNPFFKPKLSNKPSKIFWRTLFLKKRTKYQELNVKFLTDKNNRHQFGICTLLQCGFFGSLNKVPRKRILLGTFSSFRKYWMLEENFEPFGCPTDSLNIRRRTLQQRDSQSEMVLSTSLFGSQESWKNHWRTLKYKEENNKQLFRVYMKNFDS